MDSRLLDLLVCPVCKGSLQFDAAAQELICPRDKLAYPVRDDIPLMLVDLARDMTVPVAETQRTEQAAPVQPGV